MDARPEGVYASSSRSFGPRSGTPLGSLARCSNPLPRGGEGLSATYHRFFLRTARARLLPIAILLLGGSPKQLLPWTAWVIWVRTSAAGTERLILRAERRNEVFGRQTWRDISLSRDDDAVVSREVTPWPPSEVTDLLFSDQLRDVSEGGHTNM